MDDKRFSPNELKKCLQYLNHNEQVYVLASFLYNLSPNEVMEKFNIESLVDFNLTENSANLKLRILNAKYQDLSLYEKGLLVEYLANKYKELTVEDLPYYIWVREGKGRVDLFAKEKKTVLVDLSNLEINKDYKYLFEEIKVKTETRGRKKFDGSNKRLEDKILKQHIDRFPYFKYLSEHHDIAERNLTYFTPEEQCIIIYSCGLFNAPVMTATELAKNFGGTHAGVDQKKIKIHKALQLIEFKDVTQMSTNDWNLVQKRKAKTYPALTADNYTQVKQIIKPCTKRGSRKLDVFYASIPTEEKTPEFTEQDDESFDNFDIVVDEKDLEDIYSSSTDSLDIFINLFNKTKEYNINIITNYIKDKKGLTNDQINFLFDKYHEDRNKGIALEKSIPRTILIMSFDNLIKRALQVYSNYADFEELESIGRIGLINAIDIYEVDKDSKFMTLAYPMIWRKVHQFFSVQNKKITIHDPRVSSFEYKHNEDFDSEFGDSIADPSQEFIDDVLNEETVKLMLKYIPTKFQYVLIAKYGIYGEPKTLEEIGKDMGGLSRERIRQFHAKALKCAREVFKQTRPETLKHLKTYSVLSEEDCKNISHILQKSKTKKENSVVNK